MKRLLWLIPATLVLMIITNCEERIFDNPWDEKSALAPESWAPSNLQIEDVSITEKKLTWSYGDHHIEGFKIDRRKGDDQWQEAFSILPKEASSWNDTEIIPDPSLEYSYRLYAFAGKNNSTYIEFIIWYQCGDKISFDYRNSIVTYGTVEGQNGTCWLDRDLGALRVATAYNDSEAYGDLFQWGRGDEGHQLRNSSTTSTRSSSDNPGHSSFITHTSSPYDWRSPQNNNLWQGDGGINDVCPAGWRVPTDTELNNERLSWSSNNYNGAFASPLKFVAGGSRNDDGLLHGVGSYGTYWSSSVSGSFARSLYFFSSGANMGSNNRVYGRSVRCIRDD